MTNGVGTQLVGVGPVPVDPTGQFGRGNEGVVGVLSGVVEELRIVGGPELPVFDGALVGMSAEHGAEGFEGSFWAEFRVQVVEDREVVQRLAVRGESEEEPGVKGAEVLQVEGQVHAEDGVAPSEPAVQEDPVVFLVHVQGEGAAGLGLV